MSDLISRQVAIDALWKALYEYEDKTEKQFQESDEWNIGDWILHRIFVQNVSDINRQTIQNLPTIEAEPIKHGRWEMYGAITRGTLAVPTYRCSECKEDTNNWFWRYCPNCGAKMDGGENDSK